jgi:hypothetical protein
MVRCDWSSDVCSSDLYTPTYAGTTRLYTNIRRYYQIIHHHTQVLPDYTPTYAGTTRLYTNIRRYYQIIHHRTQLLPDYTPPYADTTRWYTNIRSNKVIHVITHKFIGQTEVTLIWLLSHNFSTYPRTRSRYLSCHGMTFVSRVWRKSLSHIIGHRVTPASNSSCL